MTDGIIYNERVASRKTELFFIALTLLFFLLLIWRVSVGSFDLLAGVFSFIFCFFLFYSLNYRTLNILLTSKFLTLNFGIFTWKVALDNIEDCVLDEIPVVKRLGGAGIHFMVVRDRYRASFNFLEYPRVVIALKRRKGPVCDISFSTRQPEEMLRLIREAVNKGT